MSLTFLDVPTALRRFDAITVGDASPVAHGRTVTSKLGPFGWERPIERICRHLRKAYEAHQRDRYRQ